MICQHCKEEITIVWALASHGRAYCRESCFYGRKEDASTGTQSHVSEPTDKQGTAPNGVLLAIQQRHHGLGSGQ